MAGGANGIQVPKERASWARPSEVWSSAQPELPLLEPASWAAPPTAEWFEISPRACFLVDVLGHLVSVNHEARRLLRSGSGVCVYGNTLSFRCEASQRIFLSALKSVCSGRHDRVRRLLRADDAEWRMIWVVGTSHPGNCFVTLSQSEDHIDVAEQLGDAFSFSRAEAAVMERLLAGHTPKQAAAELGVSTNTVRTHLRSIYGKMNVRGMTAAIRLASRLTTP